MKNLRIGLVAVFLLILTCSSALMAQAPRALGLDELYRLDALPSFKQTVEIGSISSYDRTGGNDDGFSGKYSYVRKEEGGLVIADLKGPGVITRIWTPTPTDDPLEFYFDGESTPSLRLRFSDLFSGKTYPFLTPVVGSGAGGFYAYTPIPFSKSCKVVIKAERLMFYQINYALFAPQAGIVSYPRIPREQYASHLSRAQKLLAAAGDDIAAAAAGDGISVRRLDARKTLAPGAAETLFAIEKPGRIVALKIGPASAFSGKQRDLLLRVYWDGDETPAIEAPVGDLFGYSFGEPATAALLVGTRDDRNCLYLPMPFDKSARVEVVSQRTAGSPIEVSAELAIADQPRRSNEGKLYALWRRENPTTTGRPFTFVRTKGKGHIVGFMLQAQGLISGNTEFFEGDDQTTIDGKLAIHGTGSEDVFNGGWYDVPDRWEKRLSFPLSGSLDYKKPLARTGAYRFLLSDAYPFTTSIEHTIEHGPSGNEYPTDYTGLTWLYADPAPEHEAMLPVAQRAVRDLDTVVFIPGWNTPIDAFSMQNATLEKRDDKINGENIRYLSMRARDRDVFGTHYISFQCEVPAAGMYEVSIEAIKGPEQGTVQLFRNDLPMGDAVDLFAPERVKSGTMPLATVSMQQGSNRVLLKIKSRKGELGDVAFDISKIVLKNVSK